MCGTKKICHPEFKNVLPCGCCPCKSMFYFPGEIEPVSVADMMKYAKSKGWRLHLEPNPVPGAAPITISVEELPEQVSVDRRTRTRTVPKRTNNKTVIQKSNKRVQTQSERTKARKLKKRQWHNDEIAAKRANMNSTDSSTKAANEMEIDNAIQAITKTEPTEATSMTVYQKQRPKTHFRKTKKPGRA